MNRLHFLPEHHLNDVIVVVALNLLIQLLPQSKYPPELQEKVDRRAQFILDFLNGKAPEEPHHD